MKISRIYFFSFSIMLFACANVPSKTVVAEKAQWPGKYLQENGKHEMQINLWGTESEGGLEASFVRTGSDPSNPKNAVASIVAIIDGDTAIWDLDRDCKTMFRLNKERVYVSSPESCDAPENVNGSYKRIESKN